MINPTKTRIYKRLRHPYRNILFRQAIKEVIKDPGCLLTNKEIMDKLIRGWDNEGYSALSEYLSACVEYALKNEGPILECGSGLTTIVLAIIAEKKRKTIYTLEHNQFWKLKVVKCLVKYKIYGVHIPCDPLKNYGDYDWYDPPFGTLPDKFNLVICDGPPGKTRGGRYGLIPIMKNRLSNNCVILLDDAKREKEQAIVSKWGQLVKMNVSVKGIDKPYFVININGEK